MLLKSVLALAVTMLTVGPAAATEQDDVVKSIRQWADSLNKGDSAGAIAVCAPETTIIDEFAPHVWQGKGTCAKWVVDLAAFNKSIGLTDGVTTLGKPRRVDITGDRAYVVAPMDFRYKLNGTPDAEIGATWTVALVKTPAGWRITGWCWARP